MEIRSMFEEGSDFKVRGAKMFLKKCCTHTNSLTKECIYHPMYLETFEVNASKYMNLILLIFFCTAISIARSLKKDKSTIRTIKRHLYINGRKRYQRWNISYYSSICKS